VRFDERGAPVLVGFDRGVRREDAGDAGFAAAESADDAALRALAVAVLQAAGPTAAALAAELASGALALAALPDALFALADPAPVRLASRAAPSAGAGPAGRLVAPQEPVHRPAPRLRIPAVAARWRARAVLGACRRFVRGVRLRVWLAAGSSLALLAGALVVLPGRGVASAPEAAGPAHPARPRPSATVPAAPVVPRQPVAAARVLLAERERCLDARSVACLARLESPASPVAIEDAAAVAGAGEPVAVPASGMRLRSRSGGAAVLTAGDRTVLLIDEPDGWRLRDVIGPPTRRSTARSSSPDG
jgi:hypothetical protein